MSNKLNESMILLFISITYVFVGLIVCVYYDRKNRESKPFFNIVESSLAVFSWPVFILAPVFSFFRNSFYMTIKTVLLFLDRILP